MWPVLFFFLQVSPHQTALAAYKAHKFPEAVAGFTEALKTEKAGTPEYNESVVLLGQSYYLQSKFKDAIPWLEKSTGTEAAYMLGNAYIFTQQSD